MRGKYISNHDYENVILENSGKEIEMIGFDKVEQLQRYLVIYNTDRSNLNELLIVVLDSMLIDRANPFSEIQSVCPRITSLDLSRNLFSKISTVAEICAPLHYLRTLRLTGNRFAEFNLQGELANAFKDVGWLALNMCLLTWEEVVPYIFCLP
jgi:tubulin-specific chaperone E